jgi:inosose dehydratase
MYRPLGEGDADIAGIVATLEANGYDGWYVMEQDTVLDREPQDDGPVQDVVRGANFLRGLSRV